MVQPQQHRNPDPVDVLRRFLRAFQSTARPVMPPIDDPNIGATGTNDDLLDYASQDMITKERNWDYGSRDGSGDTEAEPVRTVNNALDFLGEVGEEVIDFLSHGVDRMPVGEDRAWAMRTYSVPPNTWKATRYNVEGTQSKQIARKSNERSTLTLINLGPEVVYISDESYGATNNMPPTNARSIPISKVDGTGPYTPVAVSTQDEIWCRSLTGAACTVEVMETFGDPARLSF